jgi:uncharacterized protein YjbI with pentapeptide repeats
MIHSNPTDILCSFLDHRRTARDLALTGADLRESHLAGLRADGLDLEEADLRASSLTGVQWKACNLRDARLDGVDFTDAVLRLCELDQARATNATFVRARIENSTAQGARFDGADMTGAILTDTDFSRATLRGVNLSSVSASGADFRGADLRGASLQNAELVDADLRGADLTGADLTDADLTGADLTGAVGADPALRPEPTQWGELPAAMQPLAETMTPVVLEMLRTAGQSGALDAETAARLNEEVARQPHPAPRAMPDPDTLAIVAQMLGDLGNNPIPALLGALQQPDESDPPPEVKAMIARLRTAFSLNETATTEDVLSRLLSGIGGVKPSG